MATLSRKTLGLTQRVLGGWTRSGIEQLMYELNVPDGLVCGDSKVTLLLNVFRGLEGLGRQDLLRAIVYACADRLRPDEGPWFRQELAKDGFVLSDGQLAEDVPVADESRTALEVLVSEHADCLDAATLNHHLRECLDLYRQEKWDSSIGHARNFTEQVLADIARMIASSRGESPDLSRPVLVRRFLETSGFFDKAEREKLADGVYGYFSEEGSHPGISSQSTARVCMHILWAFGYYVLEKFADWRRTGKFREGLADG